uniref:Uncharacterized protein n=1 Tax=viral metagenome TaxID=1070528 RepID=A0A6H1Z6E2_9ZZZZ
MKRKVSDLLETWPGEKLCRIKGHSDYFRDKYGTPNPFYLVEAEDTELWPGGWRSGGAACTIYGKRNGVELLPTEGRIYYGHVLCEAPGSDGSYSSICPLGEVVHESELEPVEDEEIDLATSVNLTFENLDPGLFSDDITVFVGPATRRNTALEEI